MVTGDSMEKYDLSYLVRLFNVNEVVSNSASLISAAFKIHNKTIFINVAFG